ncbi:MAG: multicopper oxidase family protein [Candidatus Nanopelagicales bacterium]
MQRSPVLSRRTLLTAGAALALAGCTRAPQRLAAQATASAEPVPSPGKVRALTLTARPRQVDLGGQVVSTWAYGDTIPGAPIRVTAGDRVQVSFGNELPEPTTVHWHGLALPNTMDGVPGVTMAPVATGGTFAYDFTVPDPGTHWFHPHAGLHLDRGLYAPFIIEDPNEPGDYDHEWVLVLDDWLDGLDGTPEQAFADLVAAGGQATSSDPMGGIGAMGAMMAHDDAGDVTYPLHLINGRPSNDPDVLTGKPGQRVRLRIINAAADTIYTVALAEHDLTITHSDGYPVSPVTTPALRIGMGERYDATVTLGDGGFPLVAAPAGGTGLARAILRTGQGPCPRGPTGPQDWTVPR